MSAGNLPRVPLHVQDPAFAKSQEKNPSYESFRENLQHKPQYRGDMNDTRNTMQDRYLIRRLPSGQLDMLWTANQILLAIKRAEFGEPMTRVEQSLLTVVLPIRFRLVEPQQAYVDTKLSDSERDMLQEYVVAKLKEIDNWSAGFGGGSTPGRTRTDVGG